MTPRSVLLEWSFIDALVDPAHPSQHDVVVMWDGLVDAFERHELHLRARHDHLQRVGRPIRSSLLAPVDTIYVAGEHRRAAQRLDLPFPVDPDVAVTLVVMRRERIKAVASLHPAFDSIDLTVLR